MDGIWFYLDNNSKNGTVYNDRHVDAGRNGRIKPIMLSDGDVLIFGGGKNPAINCRTIWCMYSTRYFSEQWQVVDTKGYTILDVSDGEDIIRYDSPAKGTVMGKNRGIVIYMGDFC